MTHHILEHVEHCTGQKSKLMHFLANMFQCLRRMIKTIMIIRCALIMIIWIMRSTSYAGAGVEHRDNDKENHDNKVHPYNDNLDNEEYLICRCRC